MVTAWLLAVTGLRLSGDCQETVECLVTASRLPEVPAHRLPDGCHGNCLVADWRLSVCVWMCICVYIVSEHK